MSVRILPITDHEVYTVNGKTVYKDRENNWICNVALTTQETIAFNNYKESIIENKDLKKHMKSTYKAH